MQTIEIKKYYNNEIIKMEVMDRETLVNYILYDIDRDKLIHNVYDEARKNGGSCGVAEAYIDAKTGEIKITLGERYGFNQGFFQSTDYTDICLYTLRYDGCDSLNYPENDRDLLTEKEHLDYLQELINIKGEKAYDLVYEVIDHFQLDEDELYEKYWESTDSASEDIREDILEQIDNLYSYAVEK